MIKQLGTVLAAVVIVWTVYLRWKRPPYFNPDHYYRARDIHGMVHLGRSSTDPPATVACGYERNHMAEEIDGLAWPGERLDGTICPLCLKVLRPDL